MHKWNSPARQPDVEHGSVDDEPQPWRAEVDAAIDAELEAAIEYKLATSGFAGVAEIVAALDRSVRRRWVRRSVT